MSTSMGLVLIVGKAMIWLIIPLLFGIYEMRRHKRMLKEEADGRAPEPDALPSWLQAPRPTDAPRRGPLPPPAIEAEHASAEDGTKPAHPATTTRSADARAEQLETA